MSIEQECKKGNKEISIALCTYNGAKYLEEQLQSIAEQSLLPAEMVICDDQSSDNTVEIIKRFKQEVSFPVRLFENKERLGVVRNFNQALTYCRGDYIALSDQDDLWLQSRLEKSYQALQRLESDEGKNKPLLVHSDLMLGDAGGRVIAPSFKQRNKLRFVARDPLNNLLVQNFVTGCTVLINRPLLDTALPIPDSAMMHDRWLALIAAAEGKIISLVEPTVIYRQHDYNLIGSKALYTRLTMKKLFNTSVLEKELAAKIKQGYALKARVNDNQESSNLSEDIDLFLCYARNKPFKAAITALRYDIGMYPWTKNLLFILLLIKGGYLSYL